MNKKLNNAFTFLGGRCVKGVWLTVGVRRKSDVLPTQIRQVILAKIPVLTDDS